MWGIAELADAGSMMSMIEDVSEERSPTWTPLAAKVMCAGGDGGRSGGGISSISSFGGTGVFDMLNTGNKHTQTIDSS